MANAILSKPTYILELTKEQLDQHHRLSYLGSLLCQLFQEARDTDDLRSSFSTAYEVAQYAQNWWTTGLSLADQYGDLLRKLMPIYGQAHRVH